MIAYRAARRASVRILSFVTFIVAVDIAKANEQPPAPPNANAYELRYKLATGDVVRYDVKHRASIRSTIDQTTQEAQTKTDSVKLWKITDVLPNGDIEVMNVVESVHMLNQLPDRDPTEYDSRQDKTPPPGFEDAARAVGVPLSVVRMTPAGEVLRRDVKVRQQNVEEDGPIVLRLPDKPVTIGETWDEPFDVKVSLENGSTKAVQTRRRHKLTGVKSGIATIEVTYQVLSPIDPFIETQLVQRLMDGEVKFDIEAGRVDEPENGYRQAHPWLCRPHQQHALRHAHGGKARERDSRGGRTEANGTSRCRIPTPPRRSRHRSPGRHVHTRTSRSTSRQRQTQGVKAIAANRGRESSNRVEIERRSSCERRGFQNSLSTPDPFSLTTNKVVGSRVCVRVLECVEILCRCGSWAAVEDSRPGDYGPSTSCTSTMSCTPPANHSPSGPAARCEPPTITMRSPLRGVAQRGTPTRRRA